MKISPSIVPPYPLTDIDLLDISPEWEVRSRFYKRYILLLLVFVLIIEIKQHFEPLNNILIFDLGGSSL